MNFFSEMLDVAKVCVICQDKECDYSVVCDSCKPRYNFMLGYLYALGVQGEQRYNMAACIEFLLSEVQQNGGCMFEQDGIRNALGLGKDTQIEASDYCVFMSLVDLVEVIFYKEPEDTRSVFVSHGFGGLYNHLVSFHPHFNANA